MWSIHDGPAGSAAATAVHRLGLRVPLGALALPNDRQRVETATDSAGRRRPQFLDAPVPGHLRRGRLLRCRYDRMQGHNELLGTEDADRWPRSALRFERLQCFYNLFRLCRIT